jgi:hypothetical protein
MGGSAASYVWVSGRLEKKNSISFKESRRMATQVNTGLWATFVSVAPGVSEDWFQPG